MKPRTVFMIETGVVVALLSLTFAFASMRVAQAQEKTVPEPAAAKNSPPPAPAGEPAEAPPAVPVQAPLPLELSEGMDEIVQLARSGVSEEVLLAFLEKSGRAYQPTVEEIIYLKDLGVSPAALAALIRTGNQDSTLAKQVEAGDFKSLEAGAGDAAAGTTGSNAATTVNVYAAAPQPIDETPVATDVAAEAATEVDLDYFKTTLSPYGTWVYVDGYGECWRPTVGMVSSDWRPYYDGGRWIYTNCGWYWLSDYSWGWAPFHYGRWHQHANWGWMWVPGYTWGPAWVEWRTTSAYCGWAPLPPYYGSSFGYSYWGGYWGGSWGFSIGWNCYNWVPYRYCNGYYPRHYAVHHGREGHYRNSTVVNPTININGNNNTVIVTGPDATVVANSGRTEIRRVNIRDVGGSPAGGTRDYLENGGQTLAAYRPTLRPERARPETVLANQRSEFRRSSVVRPVTASASGVPVTDAEAANPRNIIVRGSESSTMREPASYSNWRSSVSRPTDSAVTPRVAGQNTTLSSRPEYRRPATESTPIRPSVTVNRPVPLGETVVGGANRTETSRSVSSFATTPRPSLNSVPRQSVTIPDRSFRSPTVADAPSFAPSRRSVPDDNRSSSVTPSASYRGESTRSWPTFAPSSAPSRVEAPSSRSPAMSPPSIAPSSRSSYTPSAPSFSRPAPSAPSSRSFSSPPPSSSPSRSVSPPSSSAPSRPSSPSNTGVGGRTSGGPSRRGN